jgi:CheY-like chemotaxis protein
MLTQEEFLEHLRKALNHLYEPDRLRRNPLAALFGVANRLDTFSTLQRILTEAIGSLEPTADEPPQSRAWEIYEPLYYRYVQQLDQRRVARQLGMSVRHLRRKEHAAVVVLASHLWEQFELEAKLRKGAYEDENENEKAVGDFHVDQELAWLKDVPPESLTDLSQVLSEVLDLAEPLAVQLEVPLDISMADDLPSLAAHSVALSQTLLNLLSVAIHQAAGDRVSLSARVLRPVVEVAVHSAPSTSGPRPLSNDDTASLDMARRLAEMCGGRLALAAGDEQAFSATLTLPAPEQLLVLVIDDNADTLQLLKRYATGTRYRLITTQDPARALGLVEKFSPQIIVLDVMMPRIDGWKMLAQLRQRLSAQHTPIIVCTILPQEEMAFALGASGFVHKPVTRQAFLAALDRQLEWRGTESG